MKSCVSKDEIEEILVYTHVGDDTIVACRGTELKEFVGLYSLGMLTFQLKSAFFYNIKLVQSFHSWHSFFSYSCITKYTVTIHSFTVYTYILYFT